VLTGFGTIESAVEAMKHGAADYMIKDARPQEILLSIERVLKLAIARWRCWEISARCCKTASRWSRWVQF